MGAEDEGFRRRLLEQHLSITPGLIVGLNARGEIAFLNEAGAAILETTVADALGKDWFATFVAAEQVDALRAVFEGLLAGEEQHRRHENAIRTARGTPRTIIWQNTVLRDETGAVAGTLSAGLDVSDRRQAEERFRLLFEHAGDYILLIALRPDGPPLIRDANAAALRAHGYAREELVGQPITLIDPYSAPEMLAELQRVVVERGTAIFEVRHRRKDGTSFAAEIQAALLRSDGETLVISIERDITARKQTEDQLRKSEERYRELVESMTSALAVYEPVDDGEDFVFRDFNRQGERMEGVRREELIGRRVTEAFPGVKAFGLFALFQRVHRTGEPAYLPPTLYRDDHTVGEGIWRENFVYKLPSGEIVALYNDVTRPIQALEALRASQEELERYLEIIESMILVLDTESRVVLINRKGCAILGRPAAEIVGKPWFDHFIPERIRTEMRERCASIMRGELELASYFENPVLTAAGEERLIAWRNSLLRDRRGAILGTISACEDITERRRSEEERERLQAQLFQAQKMESIGTLAGGVAHDFNNLLGGILGSLSILELELAERPELLEEIGESKALVERGAELTRQLLGFARRGKYDARPLDLHAVVEKVARMFGRTRKDLTIRLDHEANLPAVLADRTQLEQVILNLLLNAGQAMPDGGPLRLATEVVVLDAAQAAAHRVSPGRYLRLTVVDTGVGMDEATRARIFEPFFTTKGPGHGTGLGLASVYGIVTHHGGFVSVESEPSAGSSFAVHLPAAEAKAGEVTTGTSGSLTVLLVDDEEQILRTTGRLLAALGYQVLRARSGREAIDRYRARSAEIAVVILDLVMPGLSGRETLEALRRIQPTLKILLSSGYTLEGQAAELLQSPETVFIQKPYSLDSLSQGLHRLLTQP